MLNVEEPPLLAPTHDARGRFVKGNPGGPGNAVARRMAAIRQAVFDAIGPDAILELLSSLHKRAMGGNMTAARLLLLYTLGKPVAMDDCAAPAAAPQAEPAPVAEAEAAAAPAAEDSPKAPPASAEGAEPALSPLERADLRRAARRAAKKAARAARKAAHRSG
jgi:hypothetical protein